MSKFLSGRLRRLLVGITGYTENNTVVQTTGKVGIGTTDAQQHSLYVVGSTNITGDNIVGGGLTAVGIGSFQDDVYIDNELYVGGVNITGGANVGEDITTRNLKVTGISTVVGISTVESTLFAKELSVAGVSTFVGGIEIPDNSIARFGDVPNVLDTSVYHTGNTFYIENFSSSSNLSVNFDSSITFANGGGTGLYLFTDTGTLESYVEVQYTDDNTIGNVDSGSFRVDGGAGIAKNLTVGAGLSVTDGAFLNDVNVTGIVTATAFHGAIKIDESEDDDVAYNVVFTDTVGGGDPTNPHHALQIDNGGLTFNPGTNTLVCEDAYHSGNIGLGAYLFHANDVDTFVGFPIPDTVTVRTNGVDRIYATSVGNVGINTTVPAYALDVTGTGRFTSAVDLDSHLRVTGLSTFQNNVHLLDNDKLLIGGSVGTHDGLEIYHDGNHSYIDDSGTGNLFLRSGTLSVQNLAGSKTSAIFQSGSSQQLYFNNSLKFETTGIGVSISNGGTDTATIAGPENLILDPAAVGDNTGIVRIKGDLYVDGTEFKVDSSTINLADLKVGIATNVSTSLLLDGGGIGIGDPDVAGLEKTLLWNHTNNRMEFNANLYAPNFYTGNIEASGDVDIDGHTELDGLRVSGVSTFQSDITVGSAITAYAATGIVSAIAFYGDGSNLTNTGATLSATSGVERLVTTQLTSGTMVDAATDADLTFDANTNTLNTENIKISGGISTNGTNYGSAGQLLRSASGGKWEWASVPGIFSVNNILNGFNVLEEGGTVGTAGSIHTLDFRGINVTATADPQPNGIATVTFSPTPTFTDITVTGNTTIPNVVGVTTFASDIDVDGLTELDDLNVTGVSTFQGNVNLGNNDILALGNSGLSIWWNNYANIQNNTGRLDINQYAPNENLNLTAYKTSAFLGIRVEGSTGEAQLYHLGNKKLNTTGIGVSIYDNLNVGTAVTVYGNAGIVSAISFYGDGSNLTNTGATLSAAAGTQRLVLTSLTSGTMVDAATDGDLSFTAETNELAVPNLNVGTAATISTLNVTGVSTFGAKIEGAATNNVIPFLYANYSDLPSAATYHGAFAHVHATGKAYFAHAGNWLEIVSKDVNGIIGTGTETYNVGNINITGITTLGGPVTAGSSEGVAGQYLRHVGTGVTWANFPTLRTTQTFTALAGQTTFNFTYNVDFLDVYVNGVKLSPSEYTATNGSDVVLDVAAFAGDTVELYSYNTASTYGGGGGSSYTNADVDTHLNVSSATAGQILSWNGSDYAWVADQTGGGGVGVNTSQFNVNNLHVGGISTFTSRVIFDEILEFRGLESGGANTLDWYDAGGVAKHSIIYNGTNFSIGGGEIVEIDSSDSLVIANAGTGIGTFTEHGLNLTGIVTATSFEGSGASLTGLTGAAANTYGNATSVPQIIVDANGRITGITNVLISGGGGGGTSIIVQDSQSLVGAAGTIDFGTGLSVSPVSAGIVTVTASSSGISLTDLSVTTNTAGTAALSYNDSNGVFTYTPPDLSSYLTSYTETDPVVGAISGIVKADGNGLISAATAGTDYLAPGDEYTSQWTFSASGIGNYDVTGPGFAAGSADPTIYVMRGHKYKFTNNASSHPLQIQYEFQNPSGTAYTDGVDTSVTDVITWEVRNDTPDLLHYQCTSHQNMSGRIVVLGDVVTNGSWTASAGTAQAIDTITGVSNNAIKTAEYTVHIENGSNMQSQKVLVMQNGTTAYSQEYAIMYTSTNPLVTITADINGGNLRLLATPSTGVTGDTTYTLTRQTIR